MKARTAAYFLPIFLIASAFFAISLTAVAGNFSVNGVAARAQSMQAFTSVADDPSAIFYNPAGLTQIQNTQVDTNVDYISTHLNYQNSSNNFSSSASNGVVAPSLFIASGDTSPVYLGFGIFAPFGRKVDYTVNPAVYNFEQSSLITRIDFAPTIAAKIGQYISVGASIVGSRIDASSDVLGLDEVAHGYGVTGAGGILINLPENIKFGVDYRGPEKAHLTGAGTLTAPMGNLSNNFTLDFKFPGVLSTGISWQPIPQLLFSADYDDEMWSYVDKIQRHYNNPILDGIAISPVNGENSDDFRMGMIFRPNFNNEFRLGAAYVQKAVPPQNIIPCEPDYSAAGGSIGYSYYYHSWRFDAGYEYGRLTTHVGTNTFFPGQYGGEISTILAGVNYSIT